MRQFANILKIKTALFIAVLAMMFVGFHQLLLSTAPNVFRAKEEDMSYAWFVPLFSLYILWQKRQKILASLGAGDWRGWLLAIPAVLIGFLGARGLQVRFEILAFIGLSIAITLIFYGARTAREMLFPALFLLFCMPLATYLDLITVHLRLLATSIAFNLLRGFGFDIIRQGTMIGALDGSFNIDVADPCSGLRSVFALMALTTAYAYYTQRTILKRLALMALSLPIAVFGNVARIMSICIVASVADTEFALGYYHDYSGYIVFIAAIFLMITCGELISRIGKQKRGEKSAVPRDAAPDAKCRNSPRGLVSIVLFTVLFAAAMWYQALTPKTVLEKAPAVMLGKIDGYTFQELPPSEAELRVLPGDTKFVKAIYTRENGEQKTVTAVIGGSSKSSIHRPELCLPTQGFQMINPRTVDVDGTPWRRITLAARGSSSWGFAYTFFNQDGFVTSSHLSRIFRDIWDRSVFNRIDRWVMVTIASSNDNEEEMRLFLAEIWRMIRQ